MATEIHLGLHRQHWNMCWIYRLGVWQPPGTEGTVELHLMTSNYSVIRAVVGALATLAPRTQRQAQVMQQSKTISGQVGHQQGLLQKQY